MPVKKFKDGAYYWVLRRSHVADNQVLHAPHWEPMLWDAERGAFRLRAEAICRKPEELASIGEIIERRGKRFTRKAWVPTAVNRATRKAEPIYDVVLLSMKEAAHGGTGVPIPVEVSWSAEDQNIANAFARTFSPRTR